MRRTILSALALVLVLGFTAAATANETTDVLGGTKWVHNDDANGVEIRFEFTQNGLFTFIIKDAKGTNRVKGIYSLDHDTLRLKIFENGKIDVIDVPLGTVNQFTLITKLDGRERVFYPAR